MDSLNQNHPVVRTKIGSLWEQITPKGPVFERFETDRTVDLAIIGGGMLGLSTALHSALLGLETALLEAHTIGFGASGRNTGFVVPSLKSALGPSEVKQLIGTDYANRLLRLASQSGDKVFDLIARHHIDCDGVQNGWLQPGHCQNAEDMLRQRLPDLQASGQPSRFVPRDEMKSLTGLPKLYGGLLVTSGGQINPLAYTLGLAQAAQQKGVHLFQNSPVLSIDREGPLWRVSTETSALRAKKVILATNAMVGKLCPQLLASIIPVNVFQVATKPLPDHVRDRILPQLMPVADTRRHTFALRWSENRLISGGMVWPFGHRRALAKRTFLRRISNQIPQCPPLEADAVWQGTIAATLDSLPRLIQIDNGLMAAIGCNGRGVALTSALGDPIAQLLAGKIEPENFVLPITPPRPVPFRKFAGLGPHLWLPYSNFRDGFEARGALR